MGLPPETELLLPLWVQFLTSDVAWVLPVFLAIEGVCAAYLLHLIARSGLIGMQPFKRWLIFAPLVLAAVGALNVVLNVLMLFIFAEAYAGKAAPFW